MAVFLPPEQRARLAAIMASAGRTRRVTWLSLDPLVPLGPAGRDSVQGLKLPAALVRDYQEHGVFAVLGARTFDGGTQRGRLLAIAHPSGQWVEWLDSESSGGGDTELMVDDNARDRAIYHALKAADEVAAALQTHLIEEHGADPDRAAAQNSFTNSFKLLRQARERLGEGLRAVGADDIAGSDGISLRNS